MTVERVGETKQDILTAFGMADAPERDASPRHTQSSGEALDDGESPAKPFAPAASTSLPLSRSYEVRGVVFDRLKIKAPHGSDFWEIGEVEQWQPNLNGGVVRIERLDSIRAYAELCIEAPGKLKAGEILGALNLADTKAVKAAVLGFFREAQATSQ